MKEISANCYETKILSFDDLYECKTSSLIAKEKHRLRMMDKKLLSRLFGPKEEEVTEDLRKLNNEAHIICNLHLVLLE
jgi:hypothetical protein